MTMLVKPRPISVQRRLAAALWRETSGMSRETSRSAAFISVCVRAGLRMQMRAESRDAPPDDGWRRLEDTGMRTTDLWDSAGNHLFRNEWSIHKPGLEAELV